MTDVYVRRDLITCSTRLFYTWRTSRLCVKWRIHMRNDSFIRETWLGHMCRMTEIYSWHESRPCVKWRIHIFICGTMYIHLIWTQWCRMSHTWHCIIVFTYVTLLYWSHMDTVMPHVTYVTLSYSYVTRGIVIFTYMSQLYIHLIRTQWMSHSHMWPARPYGSC